MKWYEKFREKYNKEIDFISNYKDNEIVSNLTYNIDKKGLLYCAFKVKFNNEYYDILCQYPAQYPYRRILTIVYKDRKVYTQGYHNTEGILCLFGHNPDEWKQEYGIEKIIERVIEWFKFGKFDDKGAIPDDYNMDNRLFIFPKDIETFSIGMGVFSYKQINDVCYVHSIKINEKEIKKDCTFLTENMTEKKGLIVITDKEKWGNYKYGKQTISDISSYINKYGGSKKILKKAFELHTDNCPIAIVYKNYKYKGDIFELNPNRSIKISKFYKYEEEKSLFNRSGNEDYNIMKNKKILIVGLGSIGSKICEQLSRSGIEKFYLIDKDKLSIENIIKHDLTFEDIHKFKTKAMREKIQKINPNIICNTIESDVILIGEQLNKIISESDLIISTIDDTNANLILDNWCIEKNKTIIYVNSFFKAKSGIVMISNKNMACLDCITEEVEIIKNELPNFNDGIEENYKCGVNSYIGAANYNSFIVDFGVKIILQFLLGKLSVNEKGYIYNCYFIGNETMKTNSNNEFFTDEIILKRYCFPGNRKCCVCGNE